MGKRFNSITLTGEVAMMGTSRSRKRRKKAASKTAAENRDRDLIRAVREAQGIYRTLVRTSSEAVTISDLNGKITDVSPKTLKVHGFNRRAEMIGQSAFRFIAPEDRRRALANLKRTLRGHPTTRIEYTLLKKDRTRFAGELSASLIRDADGRPKAFIAVTQDTSERRRAEQDLRKSEEKFALAFDNAPDPIFWADIGTGRIAYCNRAAARLLGKSKSEIIGCRHADLHPRQKKDHYVRLFKKHIQQRGALNEEAEIISRSGEIIPVHITASVMMINDRPIMQGIFRDISERRRIETALRESEEKYRTLTDNINTGVYRNTPGPKGRFIEANPAIVQMFGYRDRRQFLATKVAGLYLNPADRTKFNEKITRHGFVKNEELILKTKSGVPFIGSVSAVAVKDDQGRIRYYDGIIEDVTERKRAEEELRRLATTDALTGVLNRGSGLLFFNKQVRTTNLDKSKMSICYVDVDNLKTINDTLGHQQGDEALRQVARMLKTAIREGDIVCRLGGDEFLLIFPECPREQAYRIWARIEKNIAAFNESDTHRFRLNLSRGIVEYDPHLERSVDQLLGAADREMYRNKREKFK